MDLLSSVAQTIAKGERLSDEAALALFESSDLIEIGRLADQVNRARNGDRVFYNVNRHINPTNICALSCKFCAYSRKPGEDGAYAYSIDEMVVKAGEAVEQGATEVHMVGGLHPRWKFEHYKDMVQAVKTAYPQIHIKAFTAVELDWLARKARKTIAEVLVELQGVGLGSLPGGGAEIFHPEIRDAICDTKVSAEQWIDTHRTAHKLGMHSNCTMLYGHIEKYHHRVDHMRRLRQLQDETGGFNAFIPLSFQPFQNEMGIDRYTFGYDDLKTLAIARLYLDNFRHVKAYWVMLGQDIAQLALQFGANDLDGTVIEEKISRMAGGRAGMAMGRSYIEQIITKAKRTPVERDTLYNPVSRPDASPRSERISPNVEQSQAVLLREAMNKADCGHKLQLDELLNLAHHGSLHELGRLANQVPERQLDSGEASCMPILSLNLNNITSVAAAIDTLSTAGKACAAKYQVEPVGITIDLATPASPQASPAEHDLGLLLELVFACRHSFPALDLSLLGVKGVWRMAQNEHVTVTELLTCLKQAGLSRIDSSPHESETDLTQKEIIQLHRQMHAAGLCSTAKVELSAPMHGSGEPQWEAFLKRIMAFAEMAPVGGPLLALSIEASPGSFVTTSEYLRAVALARLAAHGIETIVAPLARMPTLSPASGLGTALSQHPAEKIASLCLHYGASDLGAIDVEKLSPIAVIDQIRAAGLRPLVQATRELGGRQESQPFAVNPDLRHVPRLKV